MRGRWQLLTHAGLAKNPGVVPDLSLASNSISYWLVNLINSVFEIWSHPITCHSHHCLHLRLIYHFPHLVGAATSWLVCLLPPQLPFSFIPRHSQREAMKTLTKSCPFSARKTSVAPISLKGNSESLQWPRSLSMECSLSPSGPHLHPLPHIHSPLATLCLLILSFPGSACLRTFAHLVFVWKTLP